MTALVQQASLDLPFVFDDRPGVLLNPSLAEPRDVLALFHDAPRAVVNLSYAVDRAFWGFSAFGFHVTNFGLHIVVVGLLYGWLTRALADGVRRRPQGATERHDPGPTPGVEWPAFFAAAAFGLHPLMSATSAYVSARSELLCAIGVLAALTCARRAIVGSSVSAGVFAAAFGALAAGSGAAAAGLPIMILAYDAWVLRDPGWRRRAWRVYLPALVALGLFAAWGLRVVLSGARVPPRGLLHNLLTEAVVVWRYAGLLIVPAGQSPVHQVHWVTSLTDPEGLLALLGLLAAVVAAVSLRRAAPLAAFGAICFVTALAPTSTFVPLRDAMAEPRAYVAATFFFLAAASLLAGPLASRSAARAAAVTLLVILSVLTQVRHRVWSEPLRLWEESVQRSPLAWQAHLGFAESLREIGQCPRAIPEYDATLQLNPGQPDAVKGLKDCHRRSE